MFPAPRPPRRSWSRACDTRLTASARDWPRTAPLRTDVDPLIPSCVSIRHTTDAARRRGNTLRRNVIHGFRHADGYLPGQGPGECEEGVHRAAGDPACLRGAVLRRLEHRWPVFLTRTQRPPTANHFPATA